MMQAKIAATKFRKKLFCIEGRSPDIRTNIFMSAKQNADMIMYKIPLYCLLICFMYILFSIIHDIDYKNTIPSVPATIMASPAADFFVSFSLNTTYANAMDMRILSLSIGNTTLIGPS